MFIIAQWKGFAILFSGFLIASAFAGFSLLKAYEEFCKGIKRNKKIHIWAAFFIVSFLFIITTFFTVRAAIA